LKKDGVKISDAIKEVKSVSTVEERKVRKTAEMLKGLGLQ